MMKFHHLGIAVHKLEDAMNAYENIFGCKLLSGPFDDPLQKVSVCFLAMDKPSDPMLELVAPLTNDSPLKSILSRGGAYHMCLETPELDRALAEVLAKGCVLVREPVPAVAFEGRRICWIFTPARQLVELLEEKPA